MFFPLSLFLLRRSRTGTRVPPLAVLLLVSPLLFCTGCGDRIYTGSQAVNASKTYTITVTGTATSPAGAALQHAAMVTLIVQPAS